eukprot:gene12025-16096_t
MYSIVVLIIFIIQLTLNVDSFNYLSKSIRQPLLHGLNAIRRFRPSNRDKQVSKWIESIEYDRVKSKPPTTLMEDPLIPLVESIIIAADKRKAVEISAFRVFQLTEVTSFMILIEGNSKPQNQAIALSIEEDVLQTFNVSAAMQGTAASGWILIDYGSVIVHIMTPQMKSFYKLEKRWKDAEVL